MPKSIALHFNSESSPKSQYVNSPKGAGLDFLKGAPAVGGPVRKGVNLPTTVQSWSF